MAVRYSLKSHNSVSVAAWLATNWLSQQSVWAVSSPLLKKSFHQKDSKSLQCPARTAAGCTIETTFRPCPKKCSGCTAAHLFSNPPLVFLNDPIDPKAAIPAQWTNPVNTALSSQAGRAQTELLCFVVVWAEQRWQELTEPLIQIDQLRGNWLKKSPEHMQLIEVRPASAVHRLFSQWEERLCRESFKTRSAAAWGASASSEESKKCATLIDGKVIANRINLNICSICFSLQHARALGT